MWIILHFPLTAGHTHSLHSLLCSVPQEANCYWLPDPGSLAAWLLVGSDQRECRRERSWNSPPHYTLKVWI